MTEQLERIATALERLVDLMAAGLEVDEPDVVLHEDGEVVYHCSGDAGEGFGTTTYTATVLCREGTDPFLAMDAAAKHWGVSMGSLTNRKVDWDE